VTSFKLAAEGYTALVDTLGATLCALEHHGRPMVVAQQPGTATVDYRGVVCVPWPNRLADGRYRFGGRVLEVPVTEPDRGTALHGLGVDRDWEVVSCSATEVVLALRLGSDPGYPFAVRVEAKYALGEDGLRAEILARNEGGDAAPFGSCPHPYLVAGPGRVDDWVLELDAARYLQVSPQRLLPAELSDTAGGAFDFRSGRTIGDASIDNAFTGVAARDGWCTVRVAAPDGHGVVLGWPPRTAWVQIHTGDYIRGGPRGGLAVEPMDCPPDAFNSGEDLVVLEPGAEHSLTWELSAF
jgi:aldose 1-epimerase